MVRRLRFLTGALVIVAFVCTERSFRTGSLGWLLAAGTAFVVAVVTGAIAVRVARPDDVEHSAARATFVFALIVLAGAVLYFLVGLHNLGQ